MTNEEIIDRIKNLPKVYYSKNGLINGPETYLKILFQGFEEALEAKDAQHRKEMAELVEDVPAIALDYLNIQDAVSHSEASVRVSEWKARKLKEINQSNAD
jgi:hypothetical protein